MTDSEKWAIWILGVVALTITAWFTFVAFLGNGPASQSAFALMALTAVPSISRRNLKGRVLDEREKEIANRAMLAGFRALFAVFIALVLMLGFVQGWDATFSMPMWMLSSTIWWAFMLMLTVQATTTLVLYRRGIHA